MGKSSLAAIAAAVLALAGMVYLAGTRRAKPAPETPAYVNPAVCASCHPAIAKSYALSGMGRSFSRPRPQNMVEDFAAKHTLYHRVSDRYYTMTARDGHWFERRHQIGFDGKETNVVEAEIDYIVGSGNHARTYLHQTREGKLVELPITWYTEKGGYWEMSPGYSRPDQSDFRRAISYECMSCHNGYPSGNLPASDTIFAGAGIPEGIDCQRCHGPGSAHVKAATSGSASKEAIRTAIVNPIRLSRDRQLDVCYQCHLQTTSLRSPDSIRRYNRAPFTYRPGEPLNDYLVHLDFPGQETFEIDHAAYRLSRSKCFEKSQMTCTTCHDPHRESHAAERYESVCKTCHTSGHPATVAIQGKSCIDCHMPKRRTDDVVHAVMTDHYIQRRKPASDLLAPREEIHLRTGAEVAIYGKASADAELYRDVAEAQQHGTPNPGIARLESAIRQDHPAQPEFYFELGRAYVKSGDAEKGIHWLEESLRVRPDFAPAMKELAAALADSGQLDRAAQTLEKLNPAQDADALTDLGGIYTQQGKLDQAEQALQRAVALNPDLPEAFNRLGLERLRNRDEKGAEAAFREAIRIQPDLSGAQSNLGNLLAGSGDLRQAIFHLNKAVVSDPESVDAHYNLGQAYAASGSLDRAQAEFATAVRLNPKFAKGHIDLGRLNAIRGQTVEAIAHFRQAIQINPNDGEAHFYLGDLFASQKNLEEAEQEFRMVVQSDPDNYPAHYALGRVLAARGNLAEARAHFEKAAQSPDPEMRKAIQKVIASK
jgi:tetratricopeptide (TPR) repeat protein